MKTKVETRMLLRSMIRLLIQFLELANKIDEKDFRQISLNVRTQKESIKGVLDNVSRGNLFMTIFFVRELIEGLLTSDK